MAPVIQYTVTSDGVDIAYCAVGSGPPILFMPFLPASNLEVEWQIPELRGWAEWYSGHRRYIRYDARATGQSERHVTDLTLEAHLLDLEAVLDALGIAACDIVAASFAGPIAIRFAARFPERVKHLVLWTTHAAHADVDARVSARARDQRKAIDALAAADPELFLRTWLHRAVGWVEGARASDMVELARSTVDPEEFFTALSEYREWDAGVDLRSIRVPVLVMHRRDFPASHVDVARNLAARIPGARLAIVEGSSVVPFVGDSNAILRIIEEFLGDEGVTTKRLPYPSEEPTSTLRVILFTDIEGHTAMTRKLGDEGAREVLRAHERLTRDALLAHGGSEVKTMGDGFMVSFTSARKALDCAVALQRSFAAVAGRAGEGEPLQLRVGLSAGEPISENDDLFGTAVIAAARMAEIAAGGEILVANVVRELADGRAFDFEPRGDVVLRGFDVPTGVHSLRWEAPARVL